MSDLPLTDLQWDALDAARGTMPDPDRRRSALDAVLALRPVSEPVEWKPGDWAEHPEVQIDGFEYEAGWYVLLVEETLAVALWVDGQGFNGSLDWLSHATPRCDPPESWVAAGRPGTATDPSDALHEQVRLLEADLESMTQHRDHWRALLIALGRLAPPEGSDQ